jgi:hypothetical protein
MTEIDFAQTLKNGNEHNLRERLHKDPPWLADFWVTIVERADAHGETISEAVRAYLP